MSAGWIEYIYEVCLPRSVADGKLLVRFDVFLARRPTGIAVAPWHAKLCSKVQRPARRRPKGGGRGTSNANTETCKCLSVGRVRTRLAIETTADLGKLASAFKRRGMLDREEIAQGRFWLTWALFGPFLGFATDYQAV